jgi:hypothetical protein
MEVVSALWRLGFLDKPGQGDHVDLWKLLKDHPDGRVTIHTGLDANRWYEGDITRIKRETHLSEGDLWDRTLDKSLPLDEYNTMLMGKRKWELVIPAQAEAVKRKVLEAEAGRARAPESRPARKRPRKKGRKTK